MSLAGPSGNMLRQRRHLLRTRARIYGALGGKGVVYTNAGTGRSGHRCGQDVRLIKATSFRRRLHAWDVI